MYFLMGCGQPVLLLCCWCTVDACGARWDVSKLEPLVAAPHSPDNRKTARECSDVKIDRVYIGSCTGVLSTGWDGRV